MLTLAYPFPIALAMLLTGAAALQNWFPFAALLALAIASLVFAVLNPEVIVDLFSRF